LEVRRDSLEEYLKSIYGQQVRLKGIRKMGETVATEEDVKGFGYGAPLMVDYVKDGKVMSAVLSTMRAQKGFGHDHFSDRAGILIWQNDVFARLPRHVASLDVGYFTPEGRLVSAGEAEEYFLLMEKVEGREYFYDLEKVKESGAQELDRKRALALSSYLAEIHSLKLDSPPLYQRKIRDTVGHGECIFGIFDDYPDDPGFLERGELCQIEKLCVEWRWRLRGKAHRLCQVHGDFHPWNVMFLEGTDFTVLDRSRGEWGEAADDLTAMAMNYIFYSVQKHGRLTGDLQEIFELFFESYLEKTHDRELLEVIAPFFAFRAAVVASPTWYPLLSGQTRKILFNFLWNVLRSESFDYMDVNSYLKIVK